MMLRRFLAKGWMEALIQQGVSSPERIMNALQDIIWTVITNPLWQERNDIRHGKHNIYGKKEAENLNNEFLRYRDLFPAKIDVRNLPTTMNETKKHWINNLDIVMESCKSGQGQTEN